MHSSNFLLHLNNLKSGNTTGTTVPSYFGDLEKSSDAFPNFDVDQLCLMEIKIKTQQAGGHYTLMERKLIQHGSAPLFELGWEREPSALPLVSLSSLGTQSPQNMGIAFPSRSFWRK